MTLGVGLYQLHNTSSTTRHRDAWSSIVTDATNVQVHAEAYLNAMIVYLQSIGCKDPTSIALTHKIAYNANTSSTFVIPPASIIRYRHVRK